MTVNFNPAFDMGRAASLRDTQPGIEEIAVEVEVVEEAVDEAEGSPGEEDYSKLVEVEAREEMGFDNNVAFGQPTPGTEAPAPVAPVRTLGVAPSDSTSIASGASFDDVQQQLADNDGGAVVFETRMPGTVDEGPGRRNSQIRATLRDAGIQSRIRTNDEYSYNIVLTNPENLTPEQLEVLESVLSDVGFLQTVEAPVREQMAMETGMTQEQVHETLISEANQGKDLRIQTRQDNFASSRDDMIEARLEAAGINYEMAYDDSYYRDVIIQNPEELTPEQIETIEELLGDLGFYPEPPAREQMAMEAGMTTDQVHEALTSEANQGKDLRIQTRQDNFDSSRDDMIEARLEAAGIDYEMAYDDSYYRDVIIQNPEELTPEQIETIEELLGDLGFIEDPVEPIETMEFSREDSTEDILTALRSEENYEKQIVIHSNIDSFSWTRSDVENDLRNMGIEIETGEGYQFDIIIPDPASLSEEQRLLLQSVLQEELRMQ